MKAGVIKILLVCVFVIFVFLLLRFTHTSSNTEGFNDTIGEKVQDRANPMAAKQHPLRNPAAPIGISESSGASLRSMSQTALNVPIQVPNGDGSFSTRDPINKASPRIDNEASFLGLVKFCKEIGSIPDTNPFANADFAANCGMCMTSGTLITGETFTQPTGIVVYSKDKDAYYAKQAANAYKFPRAIPSVKSAVCKGATVNDDSVPPILAINSKMYVEISRRNKCRIEQSYGNSCGQCVSDTTSWSYIQNPPDGGIYEVHMILYGQGTVQVSVKGNTVASNQPLGSNATVINLGVVPEDSTFQIKATPDKNGNPPRIYGVLQSTLPNGYLFYLPIEQVILVDEVSGSTPRRLSPKFFSDVERALASIIPSAGKTQMILNGVVALTFINPDQISFYDCQNAPYVMSQTNAELLVADPCLNPKGQGPNNYTDECVQSLLFNAGCGINGDWYMNGLPGAATVDATKGDINTWLAKTIPKAKTDPAVAKGCYGNDITTPCDEFIGTSSIPNQKCLAYLYSNTSLQNANVGQAYSSRDGYYTSLNKNTAQFCQPNGSLNPNTNAGLAELQNAAKGYKGYAGVDAVKAYLTDAFTKAVGNLDINIDDSAGGRKTSWMKCFGVIINAPDSISQNLQYRALPGSGILLGQHCDNTGWSRVLGVGDYDLTNNSAAFPPDASFITVPYGFSATIYTGSLGSGRSKSFVGPDSWSFCNEGAWANDTIRAIRVTYTN